MRKGWEKCPRCLTELGYLQGCEDQNGHYECPAYAGGCGERYDSDNDVVFVKQVPDGSLLVNEGLVVR